MFGCLTVLWVTGRIERGTRVFWLRTAGFGCVGGLI